jgi:hypothetical protein
VRLIVFVVHLVWLCSAFRHGDRSSVLKPLGVSLALSHTIYVLTWTMHARILFLSNSNIS